MLSCAHPFDLLMVFSGDPYLPTVDMVSLFRAVGLISGLERAEQVGHQPGPLLQSLSIRQADT